MKILHVTKKYPNALGGDAIVVANLETQQKLCGHEVAILTSNCDEIKKGEHIHAFGFKDTPAGLDAITIKRLLSLVMLFFKSFSVIRNEKPDVIHSHSVDMAFCISLAARMYKVPIIHTFHIVTFNDPQQSSLRRKTELFFLRGTNPAKVLVLNPGDVKDFENHGFQNVQFVPNGVTVEDWQTTGIPKNKQFTFITVGRLEEQKGLTYLVDAATELHAQGYDFQVQIAGDGSQRALIENCIRENKLENTVHLLGRKTPAELKQLYAEAHVFVLPSLWEAFPLTILEAWAAKLAVIATAVGFASQQRKAPELIVVEPKDSTALTASMKALIDTPAKAEQLAIAGNAAAQTKYTWKLVNDTVTDIYQEATI